VSANHILQIFLSAENFPEWKCAFMFLSNISSLQESCRFIEYTTSVVQNIGNVVTSFSELSTNNKHTMLDLGVKEQPQHMQERHYQV
jgi:hypothetical protein